MRHAAFGPRTSRDIRDVIAIERKADVSGHRPKTESDPQDMDGRELT
jgi:hypothetical protein